MTAPELVIAVIALVAIGYWVTQQLINYAHKKELLDIANHRSSHTHATPRIGGLGFVAVIVLLLPIYCFYYMPSEALNLLCFVFLPGVLVAVTGLMDDIRGVSRRLRFLLYFVSALIAVGNLKLLGEQSLLLMLPAGLVIAFCISWFINLFNFMDGIDGIAGSQAIFLLLALAGFLSVNHATPLATALLLAAAPIAGFLLSNWQPARIFMGDIGSTFLGCFIASLMLYAINNSSINLFAAVILTAGFWLDASWTLAYRMISGQRWYQAHRSHSYQILSRKFGSHQTVTLGLTAVNLLWLLPLAILTNQLPGYALLITTISLLPLTGLCFIIGAGKSSSN